VLGLLAVGYVVVRDADRSDAKFTIVSGPPAPVIPTVMPAKPTRYTVVPTPVRGAGYLFLQVGTYLQRPKDTIVLSALDGRGARIARCVFPPGAYVDNGKLRCPLPDISRARGLIVTRKGTARIALYANRKQAGYLVKDEAGSFGGRVSTVLSRVAVPLPNGLGSGVLIVGLLGSVALTALALLLAVREPQPTPASGQTSTGDSDPSSTDAGSSAVDPGAGPGE
jgi:hypothetical protein